MLPQRAKSRHVTASFTQGSGTGKEIIFRERRGACRRKVNVPVRSVGIQHLSYSAYFAWHALLNRQNAVLMAADAFVFCKNK